MDLERFEIVLILVELGSLDCVVVVLYCIQVLRSVVWSVEVVPICRADVLAS